MLAPLSRQLGPLSRRPAAAVVDPRFVYDTFTDADNTQLEGNHTGEIGATWIGSATAYGGQAADAKIVNNRATCTGGVTRRYAEGVGASANHDIRSNMYCVTDSGYFYMFGRLQTGATLTVYELRWSATDKKWRIAKFLANTRTDLATSGALSNYANGASLAVRFTINGTGGSVVLTAYADDTQVLQATDSTSPITSNGLAGIGWFSSATHWHFTDFEARNL